MIGERLKLARKKSGFSLRALSEHIDSLVSAQAIGKYERNEMIPGSNVLIAISKAVGEPISFFMNPLGVSLAEVDFRKTSGTSVKDRARVESAVLDHVERYLVVEELLELDSAIWDQPFRPKKLKEIKDAENLAATLREKWDLGYDAIPDMTELLEEHGVKVIQAELPPKVSGMTCLVQRSDHRASVPVIVVNSTHNLERRRLTLAHELAHRLIHQNSEADVEKVANRFAGALLMPRDYILEEVGNRRNAIGYQEIIDLKHMYRVSAAAVLVRLEQLGVISHSAMVYAFRTMFRGCRTVEPVPINDPDAENAKRFERLCYRALSEQLVSLSKAADLLRIHTNEIERAVRGPEVVANSH
ncbi:helix-turn-helix domain-containing protein [Elongatibacter sediminis]|uniref:XRE family transcriptional regulator n=1 Tax=Elongatibacter sediminis TaxID=3119006 RepID=A0AAW9RHE4_9GAMM